jgi:hypothetical protein
MFEEFLLDKSKSIAELFEIIKQKTKELKVITF